MKNKYLLLTVLLSLTGCSLIETNSCSSSSSTPESDSTNIENSSSVKDSTSIDSTNSSSIDNPSTPSESSAPSESSVPSESSNPNESNTSNETSSPSISDGPIVDGELNVTLAGYSFESAYFQWEQYNNATSYNVYCDNKLIDHQLIRKYPSYYRADIVGLSAQIHTIDIVPVYNNKEMLNVKESYQVTPKAHIREGFAFTNGTSSGAYNDDGTLKENAQVIYIDNNNKDTITYKIKSSSNGYSDCIGIQNILTTLKKGYDTRPFAFRFIGNITDPANMAKGDLIIDMNSKTLGGITIEGVGNDATFNGFGLVLKNSSNVEVRNLGFMNCDSSEGDNVSLQQDNHHIWIHNNDLFYGKAGSDSDQAKGDGALDTKKSSYITHSYNHFWDSGKCNLQGMKEEKTENYITYHHNWYDHSDSRHPRVRTCTVHVYNNYYDGNSKYGIGATMGSSIFVENNYFRNCKNPMLSSKQGTDAQGDGTFSGEDGGIIKAYGNVIVGGKTPIAYSTNTTSFDYYDAKTRNETVPQNIVTLQGNTKYNNFDTASSMYSYNVQTAEEAKENVMLYAGRVQGGDFKFTFTNEDDSKYDVNKELQNKLVNYVGFVPNQSSNTNPDNGGNTQPDNGGNTQPDDNDNPNPPVTESNLTLTFNSIQSGTLSSNKVVDSVYTLMATNDKVMKIESANVTVEGIKYTTVLKLEGGGNKDYRNIKINLTGAATIKVIAKNNSTSQPRQLALLNSEGTTLKAFDSPIGNASILTYTVSESGTYHICSLSGGILIYGIIIEYN